MKKNQNNQQKIIRRRTENQRNSRQNSGGNFDELWIYGKHPVFAALKNKIRKVFEVLATKNSISELEIFLKNNSLSHLENIIKIVDNKRLDSIVGKGQTHQGLVIRSSRLPVKNQYEILEELYLYIEQDKKLPTLLLLDQISDPHNIGAIIRSAVGFGIKKIIFCEHNAPKENATIVKSSAGAIENVDLIVVTNFNNLIEKLKKIDYWCVGLAAEGLMPITKIKDYKNIALIVGSEGNGLRDLVKKNCDVLTRIEIDQRLESLNASVATSIALYEISRS
jgi:23S rRNA (guanosine2251-2'-O)-methyltransferase